MNTNNTICLFCVTSTRSGIGDGFLSLVNAMQPDANIVVIKGQPYNNDEYDIDKNKILTVSFSISKPLSYLSHKDWSRLTTFAKQHNVGHIFFYSTAPINALTLSFVRNVTYSLWCHDPIPHPGEKLHTVLPKEIDLKLLLRGKRCRKVFVSSNYLKQILCEHKKVRPEIIDSHPLPYVEEIVRHGKPRAYNDRQFDIIFWGRIESYKGLDILGAALLKLKEQGQQFSALIAGSGPLDDFLPKELLQSPSLCIKNRYVSNEELAEDMCNSKIAVFPYLSSTGTHTVQTSLSLGCRVIATDVGSFPELLTINGTQAGQLVPPNDPEQLALQLINMLQDNSYDSTQAKYFRSAFSPATWSQAILKGITPNDQH